MNIFILHEHPRIAAQHQCDKHVVKMVLESAQMLCTVASLSNVQGAPYRETHKNHPCTIWARSSIQNWTWLLEHSFGLSAEYTYRYGKVHKSSAAILWASKNCPSLPDTGLTPFAQAMPQQYKHADAVTAYRAYYIGEKSFARWNRGRPAPAWWPYTCV